MSLFEIVKSTSWIDVLQLIFAIVGGGYALFLFYQSNKEKRNQLILDIYNKIYDDKEIREILYTVDSGDSSEIKFQGKLEKEADKTLRFFDFVGHLIEDKSLTKHDVSVFKYEIGRILNDENVKNYIHWLNLIGVKLEHLKYFEKIDLKPKDVEKKMK